MHLKVIMRKDRLILKRRRACRIGLMLAPPLFFFLATLQYILIDTSRTQGELMTENFYYTTNNAMHVVHPGEDYVTPDSYLFGSKEMPKGASDFSYGSFAFQ
jgi:hypothetical protein